MPLHLLGKKSWNVYNPENIARVRQDEAAAKARAERDEREQRDRTAASRLEALRDGRTSIEAQDVPPAVNGHDLVSKSSGRIGPPSYKKRKLASEDDTDRDIRLARTEPVTTRQDFSVIDSKGHIDLVPERRRHHQHQQKDEAAPQEGMRLRDAIGYSKNNNKDETGSRPWYTNSTSADPTVAAAATAAAARDVWGNPDPRRHEREQARVRASDPLLAIKSGVKQLRENEKQRREWTEQRERDLYEVERLARREQQQRKRKRRHQDGSDSGSDDQSEKDSLEGFSLDGPEEMKKKSSSHHRHEERHKDRDRDKDRNRHRHRHRHRHRSKSPDAERASHHHRRHSHGRNHHAHGNDQ